MSTAKTKTVSEKEMVGTLAFWGAQKAALEKSKLVSDEALRWLSIYTQRGNIGDEQGQIRPGKLGLWDLYYETEGVGLSQSERLLISGLSAEEVAGEERREELGHEYYINPDDPAEVREIECMEAMSPAELAAHIASLEKQLGLKSLA